MSKVNAKYSTVAEELVAHGIDRNSYEFNVLADVLDGDNNTVYNRRQRDIILQLRPQAQVKEYDGWYYIKNV